MVFKKNLLFGKDKDSETNDFFLFYSYIRQSDKEYSRISFFNTYKHKTS